MHLGLLLVFAGDGLLFPLRDVPVRCRDDPRVAALQSSVLVSDSVRSATVSAVDV